MKKILSIIAILSVFPLFALAHGGADNFIVRMTENGFEPNEMTVLEGDEIIFINNDDADRWPASNFHPTHELYPEFDAMRGIPRGESIKIKFEKVGSWRMHDHLFPHMTGLIVVLDDPEIINTESNISTTTSADSQTGFIHSIKNFFSNFLKKVKTFFTLEKKRVEASVDQVELKKFKSFDEKAKYNWLKEISTTKTPKLAWEYIKAAYNTPAGVIGNPHDMAHLVGQELFKKDGVNGLVVCEPIFAFGCYHGLMEQAFDGNSKAEYKENLAKAEVGCGLTGDENSPTYWSCIHGIGHGIATYREFNLDEALLDCDNLSEKIRTYCADGVFMEFSISAPQNFYSKEKPLSPCDTVRDPYNIGCARAQVQVMRLRLGMNTEEISDVCIKSGIQNIVYHCIDAIGYFIGQTSMGDPDKIIAGCREIKEEMSQAQCTAAASGELVFQNTLGWQESIKKTCASLKEAGEKLCSDRIENIKQSYGRN